MYIYVNTTEAALQRNFTKLFELQERVRNGTGQVLNTHMAGINTIQQEPTHLMAVMSQHSVSPHRNGTPPSRAPVAHHWRK
jgi:hypothetical protein